MSVQFEVSIRIAKPVSEVFDAVVNPDKLSGYFLESASGPLEEGKQATWEFPEFPDKFPVIVHKVRPHSLIEFEWEAMEGGYNTTTQIRFREIDAATTLVTITETGWKETEKGVKGSYMNCSGWMHMLCCMKAYLEHAINLRKGSFHMDDFKDLMS